MTHLFRYIFISTICLFGFSTVTQAQDVKMACSSWFPFVGEDLPGKGFYTQLVVQAGKKVGINVLPQVIPWKRVVTLTKSDKLDGILCPVITEERRTWLEYADEIFFVNEVGFFTTKQNPIDSIKPEDLTEKRLGSLAASAFLKDLINSGLAPKEYTNNETGFKMLAGNRFDAIYEVRTAGDYLIRSKLSDIADKIEYAGTVKRMNHSPAFRKTHPQAAELAKKLGEGFRQIKQDGTYDRILSNAHIKQY